jgi:hypothetical protein
MLIKSAAFSVTYYSQSTPLKKNNLQDLLEHQGAAPHHFAAMLPSKANRLKMPIPPTSVMLVHRDECGDQEADVDDHSRSRTSGRLVRQGDLPASANGCSSANSSSSDNSGPPTPNRNRGCINDDHSRAQSLSPGETSVAAGFLHAQQSLRPAISTSSVFAGSTRGSRRTTCSSKAKPYPIVDSASRGAREDVDVEGIGYVNVADWDSESEETLNTTSRIGSGDTSFLSDMIPLS